MSNALCYSIDRDVLFLVLLATMLFFYRSINDVISFLLQHRSILFPNITTRREKKPGEPRLSRRFKYFFKQYTLERISFCFFRTFNYQIVSFDKAKKKKKKKNAFSSSRIEINGAIEEQIEEFGIQFNI